MKQPLKCTFFFLLLNYFVIGSASAENVLYCQSELATGFFWEGGRWQSGEFQQQRWTIKFSQNFSKLHGLDKEERPPFKCKQTFGGLSGTLLCESDYENGETFLYNRQSKRFLRINPSIAGYVSETGKDYDTDTFYAGSCKEF